MSFKKLDEGSVNAVSTQLDLISTPPTNVTFSSSIWREYLPLNPIRTDQPIHFKIDSGPSYLDLAGAFIVTKMQMTEIIPGGGAAHANPVVGSIQGIGSTWIRNMRVILNDKEVYNANELYAYKSYYETELFAEKSVKEGQMSAEGWFPETKQNVHTDEGFMSKVALLQGLNEVEFTAPILADIFRQNRLMVNNVELRLELVSHKPEFMTLKLDNGNPNTYALEVTGVRLYLKHLNLMDGLALSMAKTLAAQPARYPVKRTLMKSEFINRGREELNAVLFTDHTPRRVIVGFVGSEAFNGHASKSPFLLEHFGIRSIYISANGYQYPNVPYQLAWAGNSYSRAYRDMMNACGFNRYAHTTNGITMEKFKDGFAFFVFTLTTSQEDIPGAMDLLRTGTTTLHVQFSTPVPQHGIYMITESIADGLILVDANRVVTSDLTA